MDDSSRGVRVVPGLQAMRAANAWCKSVGWPCPYPALCEVDEMTEGQETEDT